MLAKEVVATYGDRAQYVVEDLGASALATRFGVDKYPAVFVDDALVARPEDFYAWGGPETGKYLPWKELENRRRFQADLKKLIDLRLAGASLASLTPSKNDGPKALPDVELVDLAGKKFRFSDLRGKPVLVEMWATWCPACLETMTWMKRLDPNEVTVVSVAFESDRKDVEKVVARYQPPGRIVMATPAHGEAFDGPPAIPTLLLADGEGKIVKAFYGAPKTLHDDIQRALGTLGANHLAPRP